VEAPVALKVRPRKPFSFALQKKDTGWKGKAKEKKEERALVRETLS